MEFRELVVTRRTVHNYHPDVVPDSVVEESLRLSLWAPNHRLTYPWVYTWIGTQARARLADLAVDLKAVKSEKPLSEGATRAIRETVLNPSHLISLGLRRSENPAQLHEDYATLASGVQIMALHLWQHGIATKWSTGGFAVHERTYGILGADPSAVRLEGVLMIGRAQKVPDPSPRPELSQFLRKVD